MVKFLKCLLVGLCYLIPSSSIAEWEDYKKKTFQSTIDEFLESSEQFFITSGDPQLVLSTYTGEKRSIPEEREKIVRAWLKLIGEPDDTSGIFLTELQFVENGKAYWLPTQKDLIKKLDREINLGEKIWLYVMWVGPSNKDWIFVVNGFAKS